jgi:cytochrome c553
VKRERKTTGWEVSKTRTAGLPGRQSVPRIAGQRIEYLTTQLQGFRAGTRGDIDGNMSAAVKDLTDAEITTLADYISGLSTP